MSARPPSERFPQPLFLHMMDRYRARHSPAWVGLDEDGIRVAGFGGAWERYFEHAPRIGMAADSLHDALHGLLPFEEWIELPQVMMREEVYADISCLVLEGARWLLFTDVSEDTRTAWRVQQSANEYNLQRAAKSRLLDWYVGREVSRMAERGELRLNADGERRRICTLFVDMRGFTAFNERVDAQEVMRTLNQYMERLLAPVTREGGLVDKIIGDGVMAVFGMFPERDAVRDAWRSACGMMEGVRRLNERRRRDGLETLEAGIGIASGEAVLGILGSRERRTFTAIGRHVNLAARLESAARPGEILLDSETHQALVAAGLIGCCAERRMNLKGIGEVPVWVCEPALTRVGDREPSRE